jgi:hypothetical protein
MDIMQTLPGKRIALLSASLVLSACGGGGGGGGTVPPGTSIPTFTKWSDVNGTVEVHGLGQQVTGTTSESGGEFIANEPSAVTDGYSAILTFDSARELTGLALKTPATLVNFEGATFADLALSPATFVAATSGASVAIMAKPFDLGWEYQTFGVWQTGLGTTSQTFGAMSVGNSAGTAIPTTGNATFTGHIAGTYVNPVGLGYTALGTLNVVANFADNSLAFTGTTNTLHPNQITTPVVPDIGFLNFTGTANYNTSINSFTVPLQTTGGALSGNTTGQFYGPKAEELGGVFFLKGSGSETYAGAYGAVRPTPTP